MSIAKALKVGCTYSLVLDTVDLGVQILQSNFAVSDQVVLDLANLQDTGLLESPSSQLLSELPVDSSGLLTIGSLDGGREPLVLQSLNGTKNSEASRVASLHSRDNVQLGASRLDILSGGGFLLRVVCVRSVRCPQDGCDESALTSQGLGGNAGQGQDTLAIEEGLHIGTERAGALEEENVVLLSGRDGVIVEVVNDDGGTVAREVNVDFEEERADSAGSGGLAGESEDDVAVLVQEVQNVFGRQMGAKSYAMKSIESPVYSNI